MTDYYLKVFSDKSELVYPDGKHELFTEGSSSEEAQNRYHKIEEALKNGFLESQILLCRDNPSKLNFSSVIQQHTILLDKLVSSITSEVGRALVGLTVLQMTVKAIVPEQSIRLHKGGSMSNNFSWTEGISMRSLDNRYFTPTLRKYDLLRLNADGFMMTRSLAENYPYSKVYKANLRGARSEWIEIVEELETNRMNGLLALQYLLSQLINNAHEFKDLAKQTIASLKILLNKKEAHNKEWAVALMLKHISKSDYAARLMEISMHSLMQALAKIGVLGSMDLLPLSQMRSANKKHGNLADIELTENSEIIEAWDAKYGKTYLRDELEELAEKLSNHHDVKLAGFVTSEAPTRLNELYDRKKDIEDLNSVEIVICTFQEWVKLQYERVEKSKLGTIEEVSVEWVNAYTESLAQMRREIAPIDEPCQHWLISLKKIFEE